MPKTYEPIASTTLSAGTASVTFSSIPQTYTDLILVVNTKIASLEDAHALVFNSDTATNYSNTGMLGTGTASASYRQPNIAKMDAGRVGTDWSTSIFNIMNYSNTTTFKTVLSRGNSTSSGSYVGLNVGMWRSTSAITSVLVKVYNDQTMLSGSTFTLYGIKAA
jgi:hypothetical protein